MSTGSIIERLDQATSKAEIASAQAHQFINGPEETFVNTESGPVPTLAELVAQIRRQIEEALGEIDLSAYAPLLSPAFTGTPTAPTAATGANTTQVATTAFVHATKLAIQQIIDSLTAESVGADPEGTAADVLAGHLAAADPHGDRLYADGVAAAAQTAAEGYADGAATAAQSAAEGHADTVAAAAESAAKSYADAVANEAEIAAKNYADLILASAIKLCGGHDASGGLFPATTPTGGAIKAGNLWFVSVPGTLAGKPVVVGDSFFAVADNPGQTAGNWCVLDTNLGFVPEEAGTAAAAIAAHLLSLDPHGDRAYADGVVATLQATVDAALALRVRVDAAQSFDSTQKAQARANIDAEAAGTADTVIIPVYAGKVSGNRYTQFWDDFQGAAPGDWYTLSSFSVGTALSDAMIADITGHETWRGVGHFTFTNNAITASLGIGHYTSGIAGVSGSNFWRTGDRFQFVFAGATLFSPDASNDYAFSVGFTNRGAFDPWNVATTVGLSYAIIYKWRNSPYWICYSRSGTTQTEQTTITSVLHTDHIATSQRVLVEADGTVLFYVDGVLVATHDGLGKISDGDRLTPILTWRNNALIAAGSALRNLVVDAIGAMFTYPDHARPDLVWR